MSERIDHFERMRSEPERQALPEGAPSVSPDLIEWLDAEFPVRLPLVPDSLNKAVAAVSEIAGQRGEQRVIDYLKRLVRGA